MSDKASKTEKATPKKLRDARKKGDISKSQELSSALSFLSFSFIIIPLCEYFTKKSLEILQKNLYFEYQEKVLNNNLNSVWIHNVGYFFIMIFPFLLVSFICAWLFNLMQVGFLFTLKPLKPNFKKMNPISGIKNMFSTKAIFMLLKNLVKLTIVFVMTYKEIKKMLPEILNLSFVGIERVFPFFFSFVKQISLKIGLFLSILGVIDYFYQGYSYRKNLKMSKKDIRDEYKEQEGDPQVKSQRKGMYQQMMSGMMGNVKKATVILTNPTHLAIAIKYDREKDLVPIVVAKGADYVANKIKEEAKENKIPIIENKPIARSLHKTTEINEAIPEDMYETIAEILAVVYQINEANKNKI